MGVENLNEEFDKKMQNLTMTLNIERSAKISATRMLRMKERNNCIQKIKEESKENMLKTIVAPDKFQYK